MSKNAINKIKGQVISWRKFSTYDQVLIHLEDKTKHTTSNRK